MNLAPGMQSQWTTGNLQPLVLILPTECSGLENKIRMANFKQPWFQVKKNLHQKERDFGKKIKLSQIAVISKLYIKINNLNKIPYKYLGTTLLKLNNNFCPSYP